MRERGKFLLAFVGCILFVAGIVNSVLLCVLGASLHAQNHNYQATYAWAGGVLGVILFGVALFAACVWIYDEL